MILAVSVVAVAAFLAYTSKERTGTRDENQIEAANFQMFECFSNCASAGLTVHRAEAFNTLNIHHSYQVFSYASAKN